MELLPILATMLAVIVICVAAGIIHGTLYPRKYPPREDRSNWTVEQVREDNIRFDRAEREAEAIYQASRRKTAFPRFLVKATITLGFVYLSVSAIGVTNALLLLIALLLLGVLLSRSSGHYVA